MDYRYLGKSGLKLSALSFGPWLTISKHLSVKESLKLLKIAFDQGVNFFDNAERYAEGMAEAVYGQAFKYFRREDLVIASKVFWGGTGPNDIGLSRKHIIEGVKNSLRRLQVDYIDILFCHRADEHAAIDETVLAMDILIRQGLVLYWGTSEWSVSQIKEAFQIAKQLHCILPTAEQAQYNIFHRNRVEIEYQSIIEEFGFGLTTWSPLASGILSGKYNEGIKETYRLAKEKRLVTSDFEQKIEVARKLAQLAKEANCTTSQLALAWCLKNKNVSSVILGASTEEQLIENLAAVHKASQLPSSIFSCLNEPYELKVNEQL